MGGHEILFRPHRAVRSRRAVSLVELLVVAVLLGVIGLVAVPAGMSTLAMQAEQAAGRIQADISFAQSQAIVLRRPHCLVYNTTQGFYYLALASATTTPVTDPISRKQYRVLLSKGCSNAALKAGPHVQSYPDVDLSTANFDGSGTLTFNALGLPVGSDGTRLTSGTIQIAAGSRRVNIVVDPLTGTASIQDPSSQQQQQQQSSPQQQGGLLSWLFGGLVR